MVLVGWVAKSMYMGRRGFLDLIIFLISAKKGCSKAGDAIAAYVSFPANNLASHSSYFFFSFFPFSVEGMVVWVWGYVEETMTRLTMGDFSLFPPLNFSSSNQVFSNMSFHFFFLSGFVLTFDTLLLEILSRFRKKTIID